MTRFRPGRAALYLVVLTASMVLLTTTLTAGAQVPVAAQDGAGPEVAGGTQEQARDPEPMTVDRLLTLRVPAVCDFRAAHYVDGVHPDSPGPYFSIAEVVGAGDSAGFLPLQAKVGDVTGDGVDDGLMVVECTYGGNNVFFKLFVYRSDRRLLGRIPVERYVHSDIWAISYPKAKISDGTIRTTVHSWDADDAHCCPSIVTRLRFRWNGSRFVKL